MLSFHVKLTGQSVHWQHTPVTLVDTLQCSQSETPAARKWLCVYLFQSTWEIVHFKEKLNRAGANKKGNLASLTTSIALQGRHLELCMSERQYLPFPQSSSVMHPYRQERGSIFQLHGLVQKSEDCPVIIWNKNGSVYISKNMSELLMVYLYIEMMLYAEHFFCKICLTNVNIEISGHPICISRDPTWDSNPKGRKTLDLIHIWYTFTKWTPK